MQGIISLTVGKEILYCHRCGKQLGGDDFTRGRAHTFDHRQYCTGCLPQKFETPKPAPAVPKTARREASSARLPAKPSRSPLILSLVAAGVVVVLLLVFMLTPSAGPPPVVVVDDPARKAVEQAREFAKRHPQSLDEAIVLWEQAVAVTANTPFAGDAKRERDAVLARRKDRLGEELQGVEAKVQERMKSEQFGVAADMLEEAKKRHGSPEWAASINVRLGEVREAANKLFPEVKAKGVAAQAKGDSARVVELRTRLTAWGRADLLAEFEKELAGIVPREAAPPGAVVLFRFPHEGAGQPYRPYGALKNGALSAPQYQDHSVMAGFESLKPHFRIPEEGELWVTYSTNSPKMIHLRFRVQRGDKTVAHDWNIKNPELGRPVRLKAPLRQMMDFNNKLINKGDEVSSIYLLQDDPKAELVFYELLVFRTKD